jgi:hypothetical protein
VSGPLTCPRCDAQPREHARVEIDGLPQDTLGNAVAAWGPSTYERDIDGATVAPAHETASTATATPRRMPTNVMRREAVSRHTCDLILGGIVVQRGPI